jgi:peptidoglycan/LPS O-acetylase OafA/YrhL
MDERRYYGLDALRGAMMLLGIVLHASLFYMTSLPPAAPVPTDRNNAAVFDVLFEFIHVFRMPAFFVLAGFFTALLVEKRGVSGALKNRASRILLPLLAALVVILPPTAVLTLDFMLSARFGSHNFIPDVAEIEALMAEVAAKTGEPADRVPMGHLWFLYYLCLFYALIPSLRWLIKRSRRHADALAGALSKPITMAAFSLWTALTLWPFKGGQVHEGFMYFLPHPPSLLYYGSFFVFGYVFHSYRAFLGSCVQHLRAFALLALILFPLAAHLSALDNAARGASAYLHLTAVLANALCTWALIYAFIGAATRYFDRPSPWINYTAQSAYWVYLIHMPLVSLAGWWLVQYDLPAVLKFLLVCAFTTVTAFASFHYWVQNTWLGRFLHGRRLNLYWPWADRRAAVRRSPE